MVSVFSFFLYTEKSVIRKGDEFTLINFLIHELKSYILSGILFQIKDDDSIDARMQSYQLLLGEHTNGLDWLVELVLIEDLAIDVDVSYAIPGVVCFG